MSSSKSSCQEMSDKSKVFKNKSKSEQSNGEDTQKMEPKKEPSKVPSSNGITNTIESPTSSCCNVKECEVNSLANELQMIDISSILIPRGGPNLPELVRRTGGSGAANHTVSEPTRKALIEYLNRAANLNNPIHTDPNNSEVRPSTASNIPHPGIERPLIPPSNPILYESASDIRGKICDYIRTGDNDTLLHFLKIYTTYYNFDEIVNGFVNEFQSPLYLAVISCNGRAYEHLLSCYLVNVLLPHRDWNTVYHIVAEKMQFEFLAYMLDRLEKFPSRQSKTIASLKTLKNRNEETVYDIVWRLLLDPAGSHFAQYPYMNTIHELLGNCTNPTSSN